MFSKRTHRTVRVVQTVVILFLLLVGVIAQTQVRKAKRSVSPSTEFATLPQLMEQGIHEQFTLLSFTVWHDTPITEKKMNSVAKAAARLQELAVRIPRFKADYFEKFGKDDLELVDAKAGAVATIAGAISRAAEKGDQPSLEPLLIQLEASCNSCHARFRRELSGQYVEPTQPKD